MKSVIPLAFLILFYAFAMAQELPKTKESPFVCCLPETQPEFPGGQNALVKFINQNLKITPNIAGRNGKVFVSFIVNEDGSLTDITILKGLCDVCDENSLEVFKKMPKWIPGKLNGKPSKKRGISGQIRGE